MRLIFLYVADGPAPQGAKVFWDRNKKSANFYASRVEEEGYFYLLRKLVHAGIVDEVLIIIESNRSPGRRHYGPGISGLIMPTIEALEPELQGDDIIWCRGGFRTWHDFLVRQAENRRWLLLYGANTGRERWRFWNIIFNDLAGQDFVDGAGRVHLDFRKPIQPDIFKIKKEKPLYDLCIGASRIHDKKGQWRAIEIAIAYKKLYFHNLKCILPGPWAKGIETNQIKQKIQDHRLSVQVVNNVSRSELANIFNQSRLFAHLGTHGQGDRGPMEAMRCGCQLIIGYPQYHAPWVWNNDEITYVPRDPNNFKAIAERIQSLLEGNNRLIRHRIADYHKANAGISTVISPRMRKLFDFFRAHPEVNRTLLRKEYGL